MLTKIQAGTNEDGSLHTLFMPKKPKETHVVYTGPAIRGAVTTTDGTSYTVDDLFIQVDSIEHAIDVANAIGVRHEAEGHPQHSDAEPFVHTPLAYPGTATMALASAACQNAALNGIAGVGNTNTIPNVSLHSASPSTTGANENANSGSYARQACSWNAASGAMTNSTALTFSTLGSVAVTHFGTWSSATYGAGTYSIGGAFGSSVTAASITIASGAISLSAS